MGRFRQAERLNYQYSDSVVRESDQEKDLAKPP
jgi:hypothetical protein